MNTGESFSYVSNADTMTDAFNTQVYFLRNQLKTFQMVHIIQSHIPFFGKSIQCESKKWVILVSSKSLMFLPAQSLVSDQSKIKVN